MMTRVEIVEKAHLIFLTPLSGVVSPFLGKRSSIVDRMVKPLFFASHKEICSEAFSTDSLLIASLKYHPPAFDYDTKSFSGRLIWQCPLSDGFPTWSYPGVFRSLQQREDLPTLTADFGLAVISMLIQFSKKKGSEVSVLFIGFVYR